MTKRTKAELALVGITFIWGTSFTIVKSAIAHIDALDFLAQRFALASVVLIFLFWKDLRACGRRDWVAGAWIGIILWAGFTLQIKGLELTTPSKSAFVTGFSVILVPLFDSAFKRRMPSRLNQLSALSAFAGLYLLSGTRTLFPLDRGILLTFLCAVAFALHIIVVDHFARARNVNVLVVVQVSVTAIAAMACSRGHALTHFVLSSGVIAGILVTALLATALAFFVQNWAQRHTVSSRTALIFSMEPVFAALVTYFTLHELWTGRMVLGCLLIFVGIIASELKSKEKMPMEAMR